MKLKDKPAQIRHALLILLLMLQAVFLTACGDKELEQQQAFIAYLQTTVLPDSELLQPLTDQQKKQFGPYAADYHILLTFNQQYYQAMKVSLLPVLDQIKQIRVPQDYLTHRLELKQYAGALTLLGPQLVRLKKQADDARVNLKQPDALKAVYAQAYDKIITRPAELTAPVIIRAATLSDTLVHVGDFLDMQGSRVTYGIDSVAFPDALQATQYNELMIGLQSQHLQLTQALNAADALLK